MRRQRTAAEVAVGESFRIQPPLTSAYSWHQGWVSVQTRDRRERRRNGSASCAAAAGVAGASRSAPSVRTTSSSNTQRPQFERTSGRGAAAPSVSSEPRKTCDRSLIVMPLDLIPANDSLPGRKSGVSRIVADLSSPRWWIKASGASPAGRASLAPVGAGSSTESAFRVSRRCVGATSCLKNARRHQRNELATKRRFGTGVMP